MDFEQIASELAANLKRPSAHERTVTEDELKAAAAHMAKRGYVPSAAALSALEKYMQGYREGFEDAKKTVMQALGIAGEQAGYERAKNMVMNLFRAEEEENAETDEKG